MAESADAECAMSAEDHAVVDGERPVCVGQWCCGCSEHPIGKPWGWNAKAWAQHYAVAHDVEVEDG